MRRRGPCLSGRRSHQRRADGRGGGHAECACWGNAEVLAALDPVLRAFRTESLHMGPAGSARTMKLVNNMLFAAITCASAGALALAKRAGIGAQRAFGILQGSAGALIALEWLFPALPKATFLAARRSTSRSRTSAWRRRRPVCTTRLHLTLTSALPC